MRSPKRISDKDIALVMRPNGDGTVLLRTHRSGSSVSGYEVSRNCKYSDTWVDTFTDVLDTDSKYITDKVRKNVRALTEYLSNEMSELALQTIGDSLCSELTIKGNIVVTDSIVFDVHDIKRLHLFDNSVKIVFHDGDSVNLHLKREDINRMIEVYENVKTKIKSSYTLKDVA